MESKKWTLFTILVCCLFIAGGAMAVELSIGSATINKPGETTTVTMMLDKVPEGLSGYNITVSLRNPAVAEIVGVSFPSWVQLPKHGALPADVVYINGSDLSNTIVKAQSNITLATLTIRGDSPGTTGMTVFSKGIKSDNTSAINIKYSLKLGTVTVKGVTPVITPPKPVPTAAAPVVTTIAPGPSR